MKVFRIEDSKLDILDSKDDLPRRWIPATFVSNSLPLKLTHKPAINSPGRMKKRYTKIPSPISSNPSFQIHPEKSCVLIQRSTSILISFLHFPRHSPSKIIIPPFNWPRSKNSSLVNSGCSSGYAFMIMSGWFHVLLPRLAGLKRGLEA